MSTVSIPKNDMTIKADRPASLGDLERLLRRGADFYCSIPAAVAEAALATWNTGNRRLDELRVQAMRRDMAAARWLSGEVIGFGVFPDSIQIGDGQHRLRAQVLSATEQVYRVRCFKDDEEFERFVITRDSGK